MMLRDQMIASLPKLLIPCVLLATLASCDYDNTPTGPLRQDHVFLERGSVDHARIELDMGAGEMNLRGGATNLLDGTFEYNVRSWQPIFDHTVNGTHASITIKQPEHVHLGGNVRYKWNLQFNNQVLTDLRVNCGAGQARLDVGDLDLRDLEVHMGAGQVDLDLQGKPSHDYEVNVSGGVGQATIRLPANVGIWAEAHGGLGSITVTGLDKKDGHWENDLYDKAKANVRVKVQGGIGEIRIVG